MCLELSSTFTIPETGRIKERRSRQRTLGEEEARGVHQLEKSYVDQQRAVQLWMESREHGQAHNYPLVGKGQGIGHQWLANAACFAGSWVISWQTAVLASYPRQCIMNVASVL